MSYLNIYQFGVYEAASGDGINEYLYQNARLLKDEVNVNFINFNLDDPLGYEQETKDHNITIHRFGKLKHKGLSFPAGFKKWLDQIKNEEHTVFHLHSVFRLSNFALAKLLHQRDIPYIFTPHDSYSPESMRTKFILKYLVLKTTERFIMQHARTVHAITDKGALDIAPHTSNTIKTITNFVPDYSYSNIYTPPHNYICFIGRFDIYQKGIDLNLKAFTEFKRGHQDSNVPFVMVGRKRPDQFKAVQGICDELGLQEGQDIIYTGKVSDHEKYRLLRGARVYMQLSRFEGFGLSIVEALSCAKPIIISDKVPIKNFVRKFNAGWVVSNEKEATEALKEVYALSSDEYMQKAENARRCYEQSFHPSIIKPQMIKMYAHMVPTPVLA